MKLLNLFGEMQEIPEKRTSPYIHFKKMHRYRESNNKSECCKTCEYSVRMEHHNKNYYKCKKMGISNSEATDIRLKMVCDIFKKQETI